MPSLNFFTVDFFTSFLNRCTSTNTSMVELCILEITLFLLVLRESLLLFWNREVNNLFLSHSAHYSTFQSVNWKICLLWSLKFSIDREELISHIRHTICISYFKRKAILHLIFGVYSGP